MVNEFIINDYIIHNIQKIAINQIEILKSMTPMDFLEFRDLLIPASCFQSSQFRFIENALGLESESRLRFSKQNYKKFLFRPLTQERWYSFSKKENSTLLFTKRKSNIVFPSGLNSFWLDNIQKPLLDKPRLLYVGRIKVEKGIFSLLKIFDEAKVDAQLSIVGRTEGLKTNNKKVNLIGHRYDPAALIKIYDNHNIFILPSFTEAHPKVIDESLARMRPVIIFEEIQHVIQYRKGIFVSKRNVKSLLETIDFVMKNYTNIQESMAKNKLPTKKEFISQMTNILS